MESAQNWKNYDTYLFDFDGTISDTAAGIIQAWQKIFRQYGFSLPEEKLRSCVGAPLSEILRKYFDVTDEKKLEKITQEYRHIYFEEGYFECLQMYPGIKDLLAALQKRGKKLGVASMKPVDGLKHLCQKYDITQYFTVICGPGLTDMFSSKAQVLDVAFKTLPKNKAVLIGDSAFDVNGAHESGIPCIAVHYGFGTPESLSQADAHVQTVQELAQLIL